MKTMVRWLLLFPLIFVCIICSLFFLHLILYFSFTPIVTPYPELPERLLTPIVSSFTAVYATYKFAPNNKVYSMMLCGVLVLFFMIAMAVIFWSGGKFFGTPLYLRFYGFEIILSFIGVLIAIIRGFRDSVLKT